MKRCFKCGETKPLDDFHRHPAMADGHLNKCKECARAYAIAHRAANLSAYREYDRARADLPHRKAMRDEYKQSDHYRAQHAASTQR